MEKPLGSSKNWRETKGKLKNKFAKLTDKDFSFPDGKNNDFIQKLQLKLGKTEEEITKIIAEL
ncbi:MAG: general stress protein CsbD [Lutibacter sp.]|nr:general stress protein CsbD [Lutibacter sp.]MBP9600362.1 general stress protein CsbD [Lutibacter sp.]